MYLSCSDMFGSPENNYAFEMNCPKCGEEMTRGDAVIHGTLTGFMIFGRSHQPMFFRPKGGSEKQVLQPQIKYDSFFCGACRVILISTDKTL